MLSRVHFEVPSSFEISYDCCVGVGLPLFSATDVTTALDRAWSATLIYVMSPPHGANVCTFFHLWSRKQVFRGFPSCDAIGAIRLVTPPRIPKQKQKGGEWRNEQPRKENHFEQTVSCQRVPISHESLYYWQALILVACRIGGSSRAASATQGWFSIRYAQLQEKIDEKM